MSSNGLDRIPLISFFTGGGFLDLGLEQAGFNVAWTNETDPLTVEMYGFAMQNLDASSACYGTLEISETDSILDIESDEIIGNAFSDARPAMFGVVGGPPCQDFSVAGSIRGFEGERGKLTGVFLKKIHALKPAFFVMENVEGLWKVKRHRSALISKLKLVQREYAIVHDVLNALEYGVPQDRKRLFIVGFSRTYFENVDFKLANEFKWPTPIYKNALAKYNWPTRSPYLSKVIKPRGIPKELCVESCLVNEHSWKFRNANEVFRAYSQKFHTLEEGDTRSQSFKRLHRHRYSPTACYGNNEVHIHPYLPRRLSVREALRIQGVPDNYVLPQHLSNDYRNFGLTAKFKMIGNGVPVPLAKHVGFAIRQFVETQLLKQYGHLVEGETKFSHVADPVQGHKA